MKRCPIVLSLSRKRDTHPVGRQVLTFVGISSSLLCSRDGILNVQLIDLRKEFNEINEYLFLINGGQKAFILPSS